MPLNLPRIAAALNAYPWMSGRLTDSRGRAAPTYCAVGALLRYAGVTQDHIACLRQSSASIAAVYGRLLNEEYGITDLATVRRIIAANDSACSQADAIERVLGVLTCTLDVKSLARQRPGAACHAQPASGATWESDRSRWLARAVDFRFDRVTEVAVPVGGQFVESGVDEEETGRPALNGPVHIKHVVASDVDGDSSRQTKFGRNLGLTV